MKINQLLNKSFSIVLTASLIIQPIGYDTRQVYAAENSAIKDVIELPLELVDYRADSLLFQYDDFDFALAGPDFTAEAEIPGIVGVPTVANPAGNQWYTEGLIENELNPDTGLPVYKKETVDYVANKVYEVVNPTPASDAEFADFFYTLRNQMMLENPESSQPIMMSDWTSSDWIIQDEDKIIENWTYVGGDIESSVPMKSKLFETVEGNYKYDVLCWAGTGTVTAYGYTSSTDTNPVKLGEHSFTDRNHYTLKTDSIDSSVYPYFNIVYTPGENGKIYLGNNFKITCLYDEGAEDDVEVCNPPTDNWANFFSEGYFEEVIQYEMEEGAQCGWSRPAFTTAYGDIRSNEFGGRMYRTYDVESGYGYTWSGYRAGAAVDYELELSGESVETSVIKGIINATSGASDWQLTSMRFEVPEGYTQLKITYISRANQIVTLGSDWMLERDESNIRLGSYEESKAKEFTSQEDIISCYDYAYYMLNHFFDTNNVLGRNYNSIYDYLELIPVGGEIYGFLAYCSANMHGDMAVDTNGIRQALPIIYDTENKLIKSDITNEESAEEQKGFFPLSLGNIGENNLPKEYSSADFSEGEWRQYDGTRDLGDNVIETYNENFHYALKSSGKFVYHEADELFFEFTGDDDVYLFINGKLAMDIGGAHLAANKKIYLNDLKEQYGLQESTAYDFDFFYLERRTDFSNLRILTNIRVTNSEATITKDAYYADTMVTSGQFSPGVEIPVDTVVGQGTNIQYGFTINNMSDVTIEDGEKNYHPIKYLRIKDEMLGVDIGGVQADMTPIPYTEYKLYGENISADTVLDLYIHVNWVNVNGEEQVIDYNITTGQELEAFLSGASSGLAGGGGYIAGAEISIYGFKYSGENVNTTMHEDGVITNVVTGEFVSRDANNNEESVFSAGMDVNNIYISSIPEYYAEVGKSIDISLIDDNDMPILSNIVKVEIDDKGEVDWNQGDSKIAYEPVEVGDSTITVTNATDEKKYILVHNYNVNTDYYVLDYGIPVDLLDSTYGSGLFDNDNISVATKSTDYKFLGFKKERPDEYKNTSYDSVGYAGNLEMTQGDVDTQVDGVDVKEFTNTDKAQARVKYTPKKFLDGIENFYYGVQVTAKDLAESVEKNVTNATPVMVGEVNILPASSVYYEDNFAQSGTNKANGNNGIVYSGNYSYDGNVSGDRVQSNGLNIQYGYDDSYTNDGEYSNGSASKLNADTKKALFEFTGTGFDIVSRTTSNTGSITVKIYQKHKMKVDGTEVTAEIKFSEEKGAYVDPASNISNVIPVNTYYENGDLYQIPVISKKDLKYGTYIVEIAASFPAEYNAEVVYIDGIRIYNPMEGKDTTINGSEAYLPGEKNAEVRPVKKLILSEDFKFDYQNPENSTGMDNPKATLLKYSSDGAGITFMAGGTVVESFNDFINTDVSPNITKDMLTYAVSGPNNELYLQNGYAWGFEISDNVEISNEEKLLQVGIKKVSGSPIVKYLGSDNLWHNLLGESEKTVDTATEMYYDLTKLIKEGKLYRGDTEGAARIQVILSAEGENSILSFTNVKVNGYEFAPVMPTKNNSLSPQHDASLNAASITVKSGYYDKRQEFYAERYAGISFETSADVNSIKIVREGCVVANGIINKADIMKTATISYKENGNVLKWTVKFWTGEEVAKNYSIVAFDALGNYSEVIDLIQTEAN